MNVTAKTRITSKFGTLWRLRSWLRITSFTLTLALASSVALGQPLHSSDRGCNVPMDPTSCEHMPPSAPGVLNIQLCCLLDCQDAGSAGSLQTQLPSLKLVAVHQIEPKPTFSLAKLLPQSSWLQGSSFKPPDTYLKNLALLI